jgi:hypothetical protein
MSGLPQEIQLGGQVKAVRLCNVLEVQLDLVDVLPNWLRYDWKILMQFAAPNPHNGLA